MKQRIALLFLLFSINSFGQTPKLDSLKSVIKKLSNKAVSIERDSALTVTFYEICSAISLTEPETRQTWTDSMSRFCKISIWQQSRAYGYFSSGRNNHYKGYTTLAFNEMDKATSLFMKLKNEKMYAETHLRLAIIISNFILTKPINDQQTEQKYLNYLKQGLTLAKKNGSPLHIANINLCLCQYFIRHRNYKVAMQYSIDAWEITKHEPEKYFYYHQAGKWAEGLNLMYLNRQKDGLAIINRTKEICKKTRQDGAEKYLLGANGLYLGSYYIEKREFQKAINEAKIGEAALKSIKMPNFDYVLNKTFYYAFKNLGNTKEALSYFEKVHAFDQAEQTKESIGKLLELQLKYEDEKQKNQIQKLANQQLTQTRNYLLLSGILGLGVIGYVFWSNYRLKKKNQEIQEALLQGQTMERKRMASELHDNISNKILGVKMRVELLENENFTTKERNNFDATLGFIDEVYSDIRLISHNLLPDELEKQGLRIAIENLIKKLNLIGKTHFETQIQINHARFSPRLEYEVYSIILELVNNILKHAEAKNAMILIIEADKFLKVLVVDNGKGFNNQTINFESLGLKNIHSRIESLRGEIKIENEDGTKVKMQLPI